MGMRPFPLMEMEKGHILGVYEQTGRNKVQTAKLLAIGLKPFAENWPLMVWSERDRYAKTDCARMAQTL